MKPVKSVLAVILTLCLVFAMSSCLKYTSNILEVTTSSGTVTTSPFVTNAPTTSVDPGTTAAQDTSTTSAPVTSAQAQENTTAAQNNVTPSTEAPTSATVDPSSWNTAQILSAVTAAVNKTKAYTNNISVHHTESFTADIIECTGGSVVKNVANSLVSKIVAPTDETLNFSGGKAVNSEGKTVPLLLPYEGQFALTADGIASASAKKSGDNTVVTIKLVQEKCGLNDKPKYNASSIGYLDIASLDISVITITSAEIDYTGSSLVATINPDGYITTVSYSIPMHVVGQASAMGINGHATFDGAETEVWTVNW